MLLYCCEGYVLLVLLASCPIHAASVDFTQCLSNVTVCAQNASSPECVSSSGINISSAALGMLRTSAGSSVTSTDDATALSYSGCTRYCGSGQQPFSWSIFAQEYSAWLLPYLALLSQLPFGAQRRMDNFMSAVLTLGSPTLAGYSLYMTLLNARWVNDQLFSGIDYPSSMVRQSVVRVLSSLQQVPLRVHPGESARFESLVVHPDNDDWWITLAEELDYSQTWSVASATSIAWVIIAYLLTVIDSISNVSQNINNNGQGTGSVWLWLLPVVIGWLVLSPRCDYDRVHDAHRRANKQVFVADTHDPAAAPTNVTSNFGLTISGGPEWKLDGNDLTSPDELRIPPVFNYSRIFSWYQNVYLTFLFYRAAWQKSNDRVGVDGMDFPGNVRFDVSRECRLGTREQIIRYCRPDSLESTRPNVLWPRWLLFNMVVASLMSLQVQWGTTGAAVLAVWYTPTIGLGCRSLAYLMYAALSTVVWFLLVASSTLGYYAHRLVDMASPDSERAERCTSEFGGPSKPTKCLITTCLEDDGSGPLKGKNDVAIPLREVHIPNGNAEEGDVDTLPEAEADEPASTTATQCSRPKHARVIVRIADWLRWTGKSLAIVNAVGLFANSLFQYAGVYSNCYCDSSVFFWGKKFAFNVINPTQNDLELAKRAWIGALVLGLTCCSFFVGSIYLVRDSLPW